LKFKFDSNSNLFVIYKIDLKKKKKFLFEFGFWAEFLAWPAGRRRDPRVHGRALCSRAKSDRLSQVRPDSAGSNPIGD
jgi:hypothetical protein